MVRNLLKGGVGNYWPLERCESILRGRRRKRESDDCESVLPIDGSVMGPQWVWVSCHISSM